MIAGIAGIFAPSIFGMDGFDGGFAVSFISMVFTITAFVTVIFFAQRAKQAERILTGENRLAHWEYPEKAWRAYTENQLNTDKNDKRNLFLVMAGLFAIAIVVVLIIGGEAGPAVALVLLGITALLGVVAYVVPRAEHAHNVRSRGEAFISRDGVILNHVLHLWRGWGAKLEQVSIEEGEVPILKFEYSAPSGRATGYYSVRVPIPAGQMDNAVKIADEIRAAESI